MRAAHIVSLTMLGERSKQASKEYINVVFMQFDNWQTKQFFRQVPVDDQNYVEKKTRK